VPPAKRKAAEPGAPKRNRGGTPKGAIRGGRNGAQPVYTEAIAAEICDRLENGEPLNEICRSPHMPDPKAVRKWVHDRPGFGPRYARAKSIGYERLADEVIEIGDSPCLGPNGYVDNAAVQRARLMSDNRKWLLSKVLPKIYGDKVEISGDASAPLLTRIELVAVRPKLTPPTVENDD
jgi:hypothetical protein